MKPVNDSEHRRQKRWHLIYYLKVYDKNSGELIGHMADITTRGVMVINETPVEDNKAFTLSLELPENFGEDKFLEFEAESHWHDKDINPKYFANGFMITKITKKNMDILKEMIKRYFFND